MGKTSQDHFVVLVINLRIGLALENSQQETLCLLTQGHLYEILIVGGLLEIYREGVEYKIFLDILFIFKFLFNM